MPPVPPLARALLLAALGTGLACAAQAGDTTAADQLARWSAQAARPGQPDAGRQFFQTRQGRDWSCASCHGMPPTSAGRHESTGKTIAPLAPAFNPKGFTDSAKVDKWFRRNCNDVAGRECTPQEKADVLAWLLTLKP